METELPGLGIGGESGPAYEAVAVGQRLWLLSQ